MFDLNVHPQTHVCLRACKQRYSSIRVAQNSLWGAASTGCTVFRTISSTVSSMRGMRTISDLQHQCPMTHAVHVYYIECASMLQRYMYESRCLKDHVEKPCEVCRWTFCQVMKYDSKQCRLETCVSLLICKTWLQVSLSLDDGFSGPVMPAYLWFVGTTSRSFTFIQQSNQAHQNLQGATLAEKHERQKVQLCVVALRNLTSLPNLDSRSAFCCATSLASLQ